MSSRVLAPADDVIIMPVKLTDLQERFVWEYCVDWNASQAALRAGYSPKTAAHMGWENLQKPQIKDAIRARKAQIEAECELRIMGRLQVQAELTDIADGTIAYFIDDNGILDLKNIKTSGHDKLVKKIKQTFTINPETGTPIITNELEMYSRHDALRDLGKIYALFTDVLKLPKPLEELEDDELARIAAGK